MKKRMLRCVDILHQIGELRSDNADVLRNSIQNGEYSAYVYINAVLKKLSRKGFKKRSESIL